MIIVGRKEEKQILTDISQSKRPEFLIVYGRRRVGKTYLIKEFFISVSKFCKFLNFFSLDPLFVTLSLWIFHQKRGRIGPLVTT